MSDEVEVRLPADGAFVAILRTVTAGLAARCDLTMDEIDDLRIAVDEACALLLPHATPHASLQARFTLDGGRIDFAAVVPSLPDAQLDRDGFAWTVLRALTDDVHARVEGGRLSIVLSKLRAAPAS